MSSTHGADFKGNPRSRKSAKSPVWMGLKKKNVQNKFKPIEETTEMEETLRRTEKANVEGF